MKLYKQYVEPKLVSALTHGVTSATVIFDECMNPNLFNEHNIKDLQHFIQNNLCVGDAYINCQITSKTTVIGNKHTLFMWW